METNLPYDIFIAHAAEDKDDADRFYALLTAAGYRVFLDFRVLKAGTFWPSEIRQAQQNSVLTLVLISHRTDMAYFQQEEIHQAIELARKGQHRVVPLFLMTQRESAAIAHELTRLHGIYWEENSSRLDMAQKIEAALRASKRPQEKPYEIVADTIVIVTGCDLIPETFDRPAAYELKTSIDYMGKSVKRPFLRATVMGDRWFLSKMPDHPNVISLGSQWMNELSGIIAGRGKPRSMEERWQIMRDGNWWALFGNQPEDTYDVVSSFKDRNLPGFLQEIWPHY